MDLRFLDKGTDLAVYLCGPDDKICNHYSGRFYEKEKLVTFLIECEGLYERAKDIGPGNYLRIEFFHISKMYAFNGKLINKTVRDDKNLVIVNQMSEIKESARRATPRIEMSVNVRAILHDSTTRPAGYESSGVTLDISGDGLGMLSDDTIPPTERDERFFILFELGPANQFNLPARLLHRNDKPVTIQYKFAYGFLFDYTDIESERARLITALLDYQLSRDK